MHAPVLVLKDSLKRESGTRVHHANIQAAKAVADIIRTTLGPRSMLKMLLYIFIYCCSLIGIVVTNDGNSILRDLDLAHPAAKSMIELSRTQDEEVGDGTTSFIVLAGVMLHVAEAFIDKNYHPTVICRAYNKALEDSIASCIGTKFTSQFGDLIAILNVQDLAIDATTTVVVDLGQGLREVDIKNYIKVEKVPGGQLEDSKVLKGVMFNKDVVAPGKMKRKIVNPRIILLDCPLEYKKGENQTNVELVKEEDWGVLLKMEEEYIENMCMQILKFKPDLVITEKGLSDLACHYLSKAGVSAIRRLRKANNNRIVKACGAVIVNRLDELQESDVGTGAGLFVIIDVISDLFYHSLSGEKLEKVHEYNFDHPESFNTDLLLSCMEESKNGRATSIPNYDFKTHKCTDHGRQVNPSDVIIVEGILVLHEARVCDLMKMKVFVDKVCKYNNSSSCGQ
ncbi:hypothetical protein K2173_024764 [Erythroxylum novogranatense]|uniref:T-complex protein 1 subunit gamma n=1 Tax=Erythroxylum novogranatense TaxID=1862640 RepID=A0AAV8SV74_9ROSI|nr:hypothetical protein K2173_024764 [Erythroxylum novogranatense]